MLLKFAYTIFIGILLALFVGVGIAAFYPQPKYPEYPIAAEFRTDDSTQSAKMKEEQREYEKKSREFQPVIEQYNKNISMIALSFAVVFVILGLVFAGKLAIIADSLLLGGILTLLYSIVRGFGANDDIFRFLVVGVGLVIALVLGYIKFVKPSFPTK